ncbi:MAG: lasso peptide biosynthesis B2 protein [Myxacorys californica WJT36-NPBG1]|nr:lasso peptide biosynthesis B2 protein [Myxacorys californica WJT36-NPBG1]
MDHKWQAWRRLPWQERSLFLQALVLFPMIALALKLWGLQRVQTHLAKQFHDAAPVHSELFHCIAQTIYLVSRAGYYTPRWANCLKRSLILWYLLHRQGIETDLRIGVRRCNGEFQAHAWVEYQGSVLNDVPDVHELYAAFEEPISFKRLIPDRNEYPKQMIL